VRRKRVTDIGDDGQGGAEVLDDAELGADEAYVDEPPLDYPPDRPLGVAEPQVVDEGIADSVARRVDRELPEVDAAGRDPNSGGWASGAADGAPVLVEDDDGNTLTAEPVEALAGDLAPEEAALHVEDVQDEDEETWS
jgi:hypothetical protein